MKPLIVGEAPSKNEAMEHPIEGRVGKRLARCCGLSLPQFLAHFDRVNLLHVRQDTKEKGFEFDHEGATKAANELIGFFKEGQTVLLLGGRVAGAFGIYDDYFTLHQRRDAHLWVLPHPSGVNRWWNHPDNVTRMNSFMQRIVERTRV